MKNNQKFYFCDRCKSIVGLIDKDTPKICCGIEMTELVPNTVDASGEKHLPDVTVEGDSIKVQVGSVPHPMTQEHYIQFVYVETQNGGQRKQLNPGDEPNVEFSFVNDKPVAVYEYCNLHGLWKTEIK